MLKNFLKLVLPNDGYKCWVELHKGKGAIQGFVPTIEELATKLLEINSRGVDAYFACASFKSPQNRRAGNAFKVKAFWLDIDAGEGKAYATAEIAIQALDEFCDRCELDLPGVVRSGGGIHAWWPLTRELDSAEWVHTAQCFKLLTAAQGLQADPARTADVASILRPPTTKNYKLPNNPRDVSIEDEDLFEPVDTDSFIAQIKKALDKTPALSSAPREVNANLTIGITVSKAFDPSKGITEGGRNTACASYAGELLAKGYSPEETLAHCLQWNQRNEPPMPESEVRVTVNSIVRRHTANHPAPPPPVAQATFPDLPQGYKWGPAGQLITFVEDDDGIKKPRIVSERPVYLKAILNTEGGERRNSYLFSQYHTKEGWQDFPLNSDEVNGNNWYSRFFELGGSLGAGADKYFRTYIREAENMLRKPGDERTRYSQFGWKDNDKSFLVGPHLCRADGTVEVAVGTDKLTPLMEIMKPNPSGSLENWTRAANKLFTPGTEAQGFMLLAGFAACLMKFCVDEGNGGSILSIISEDSGHGKTPMATAIASIWGELAATVVTGNFTENRRIEDLVRHCHLVQVQEEMAYGDPLVASEGIKKFTSGADRGRLDRGGNASGIPERYQTILVSLSNKSLYELVKMVDVPMSRRIFEIEIERPTDEILANLGGITREMMRNSGYAGLQFIRYLVNPQIHKYVSEHLTGVDGKPGTVVMRYRDKLQTQPEHRFIVWLLASVEVAARVLTHYGILHFDTDRIMAWAIEQARERILNPGADEATTKLHQFLSENANTCLTVHSAFKPGAAPTIPVRVPSSKLYMRMELKNQRLYISQRALNEWCTKNNISFIGLGKRLLIARVLINKNKPITLGAGTEIPSARSFCWELDTSHPQMSGAVRLEELTKENPQAETA